MLASPQLKKNDLTGLKRVLLVTDSSAGRGGALAVADELRAAFRSAQVHVGLALPQLAGLATLQQAGGSGGAGSLGTATPDLELKVARADGSTARVGETGTLMAKGPAVSRGLLRADTPSGEWLSTELSAAITPDAGVVLSS